MAAAAAAGGDKNFNGNRKKRKGGGKKTQESVWCELFRGVCRCSREVTMIGLQNYILMK